LTGPLDWNASERIAAGDRQPPEVGEERIADRADNLTVIFADLVGFTEAARGLPPERSSIS
jgi:class 3 adenylate cyclase